MMTQTIQLPLHYKNALLIQLICDASTHDISNIIPEPLQLPKKSSLIWHFAMFPDVTAIELYAEAAVLVTVIHNKRQYLYCPHAWVTTGESMMVGRKFWNVPKVIGDYSLNYRNNVAQIAAELPPFHLQLDLTIESHVQGDWNFFKPSAWLMQSYTKSGNIEWNTLRFNDLKIHQFVNVVVDQFYIDGEDTASSILNASPIGSSCVVVDFTLS